MLRQTIFSGIDVAAELRKVQKRLETTSDIPRQLDQPARPEYYVWEGLSGRRETQMTRAIETYGIGLRQ
jgi:hypothetical protein